MKHDLQHYSLSEALGVYRLHCQAMRYRPSTLNYHQWTLAPFAAWLSAQAVEAIGDVTAYHVRAYLAHKAEGGASGNYVNGIARAMRAWFNWCVREELLAASPMRNVPMPKKPKKILPALSAEEIRRLVRAAADDREKALVHFLLDTGLRASECCRLRVADVDVALGTVRVVAGKGEKDRDGYIGATTSRYLLRYIRRAGLHPADPMWPSVRTGKQLTYSGLAQLLRGIAARAGVPHATAHTYRRTFAVTTWRHGMDIYALAQLMGHSDISILREYLDLVSRDREDAHRRHGVVDNL